MTAGNRILIKHSLVDPDPAVEPKQWRLSAEGRRRCAVVAEALRPHAPDLLVSSLEPKAQQTAELVAHHLALPWRSEADLDEHRRPYVPKEAFERSMAALFTRPTERAFGQESATEARLRFAAAVEQLLSRETGRRLALVAHGTVIALYAAPLLGLDPFVLWHRMSHPSFLVLALHQGADHASLVDEWPGTDGSENDL